MVRLFIKHEPVDAYPIKLNFPTGGTVAFQVLRPAVKGVECQYICFVFNGICYAAKSMERSRAGGVITFYCKPMEDQPCVQQMLLADMILS